MSSIFILILALLVIIGAFVFYAHPKHLIELAHELKDAVQDTDVSADQ